MDKETLKKFVFAPIEIAGFKAYFVGGCVRDALLNKEPHDYDICTDATPDQLHAIFRKFSNVSKNSEPFGVTMPLINDGTGKIEEIEIATLRKDITKGRHPKVDFTKSIEEDAQRRDFTINAIYEDANGKIFDPTGGINDIKNKVLRFVGKMSDRLNEDPLRVFRAIRFMSKTGFTPNFTPVELNNIVHEMIRTNAFDEVSKERILKEIEGVFGGEHFDIVFKEYFWASLIPELIGMRPIIDSLMGCKQSFKWHAEGSIIETTDLHIVEINDIKDLEKFRHLASNGNAWEHTRRVMTNMFNELNTAKITDTHLRFVMMVAAFVHDIGKPISASYGDEKKNLFKVNGFDVYEIIPRVSSHDVDGVKPSYDFCRQLGMTCKDCDFVSELTKRHMRAHQILDMKNKARLWKFVQWEHFDKLVMLARADQNACIKTVFEEWKGIDDAVEKVRKFIDNPLPAPILKGQHLIDAGYKPGPTFKKKLDVAFEQQVNRNINSVNELLKIVKGVN